MKFSHISSSFASGGCVNSLDVPIEVFLNNPQKLRKKEDGELFNMTTRSGTYRSQQYVTAYTAVILDYDNGVTIKQVEERFNFLRYALYTSYTHKQEHHKFRVILPLRKPIPAHIYHSKPFKLAIASYFADVDPSTASPDRFFYLPCDNGQYYSKLNLGNYWDWTADPKFNNLYNDNVLLAQIEADLWAKNKQDTTEKPQAYYDAIKANCEIRMSEIDFNMRGTGNVHESLLRIHANLRHNGFGDNDCWDVMGPYEKYALPNEIKNIIKSKFNAYRK